VLDGDNTSFELILRRYNQRLFRVARSLLGDDAEAEDVVQDAYLRAYQNLGRFEGRSSFSTWLTKIAVYEASARRRKLRRLWLRSASESEIDDMSLHSSHHNLSTDDASQRELRHVLSSAVDALPTDLRVVFTLRMVEHLSTIQTAECLDLTPANVKIRLYRARLQLRDTIDRQIGEESRQLFLFDGERCDRIVQAVMSRLSGAP
jgi:RNA polymerase sigma-70 factor (ECF subfamily)